MGNTESHSKHNADFSRQQDAEKDKVEVEEEKEEEEETEQIEEEKSKPCKYELLASPPKHSSYNKRYCIKSFDRKNYEIFMITATDGIHKYSNNTNSWNHFASYPTNRGVCRSTLHPRAVIVGDKIFLIHDYMGYKAVDINTKRWETLQCKVENINDRYCDGELLFVEELNEIHCIGYGSDGGHHIIYNGHQNKRLPTMNNGQKIKNHKLIYCKILNKIICIGGQTKNKLRTNFLYTTAIWEFQLNNNDTNEWVLSEYKVPYHDLYKFECILAFSHILFIFYLSQYSWDQEEIWYLDLLTNKLYNTQYRFPINATKLYLSSVNNDMTDMVHFVYSDTQNDESCIHLLIDLKDLISDEIVQQYNTHYLKLVCALCKKWKFEVIEDIQSLIVGFYCPLYNN